MKPVAAYPVTFCYLAGERVGVGIIGEGGVKSCVEHGYHGDRGAKSFPRRSNTGDGGRIMQRGKLAHLLQRRQHVVIYEDGRAEAVPARHHPVPNRVNPNRTLVQPLEDL